MGQPVDHALTTCLVGVRLGEALGFDDLTLEDVYYETLLRFVGCNPETDWMASILGDEIAFRTEYATLDTADAAAVLGLIVRFIRQAHAGENAWRVAQSVVSGLGQMSRGTPRVLSGHCEVARRLSERMGFSDRFVATVGQIYARWDGKGIPPIKGEAIAPALLCASLAQDAVIFHRIGGVASATAMARTRRAGAHAPHMVDAFCAKATSIFAGLETSPPWDQVLAIEPGRRRVLDSAQLDTALEAVADAGDLKSPWFLNHSPRVAELSVRAAERFGLPEAERRLVRRAALVHDLGKVGISVEHGLT